MNYKIGDVVVNHKHRTIGIVMDVFDRGDIRTDADGVVSVDDCEAYEPVRHGGYQIAPSTAEKIKRYGLTS